MNLKFNILSLDVNLLVKQIRNKKEEEICCRNMI